MILALPLIGSLSIRYPECSIDILASDYAAPVLQNMKVINQVIDIDNALLRSDNAYRQTLTNKLAENKYKVAVVLYPDRYISRILYRAGIPNRIGTARRFHSVYFNRHIFHSRKANKKHESEYNLDFLEFFKPGETILIPRINIDEGIVTKFIVLHPGSGGSADRWPLGHFLELCYILIRKKYSIAITGSVSERDDILRMSEKMNIEVNNLAGKTDIRTLAAIISMAEIVVANSTGPLHLAAAVGTSVVGLYPGNRAMSPVRWGPLGENHTVILPPEGDPLNMQEIKPEYVADIISNMLELAKVTE